MPRRRSGTSWSRARVNLRDRWLGRLDFTDPDSGKHYAIGDNPAVLMVRRADGTSTSVTPRSMANQSPAPVRFRPLRLAQRHARARPRLGPYFYLPEARAGTRPSCGATCSRSPKHKLRLERGTIKATVLIETLPAAFEMDEILYALRDHIVGLNCGRWDYIFSYIKRLGRTPERLTPDRSAMTMDKAFLAAYSLRLIATCHRRGAFAMGGMSAFIPVKGDETANRGALDKVRADKLREVGERPRRHLGRAPGAGAGRDECIRRDERFEPAVQDAGARSRPRGDAEATRGSADRGRRAREYPRRRPISRRLARRQAARCRSTI